MTSTASAGALDCQESPLTPEQQVAFGQLLASLSPIQTAWVAGYMAGALRSGTPGQAAQTAPSQDATTVTILYGSQTGNAESLAKETAEQVRAKGFVANVQNMSNYKVNSLKKEQYLLVIVSTHGEGDPPDTVEELHRQLHSKRAPKAADLKYSVLALGDSTYEFYCQTGKDFDIRLAELGAERLVDRVDCDLDYDDDAAAWITASLERIEALAPKASAAPAPALGFAAPAAASTYSRKNPFHAEVLDNINLSGRGSNKETRHIELSLEESGITYRPGDAVGVHPVNQTELVDEVIAAAKLSPEDAVETPAGEQSLRDALLKTYEITELTPKLIQQYAEFANGSMAELVSGDSGTIRQYMEGRELIDLLLEHPATLDAQSLINVLRRLPPRLYSIASSPEAHPEEVHILVAAVRYETHGRGRKGVCSTYFSEGLDDDTLVPIYIHENPNFRMPDDAATPMIMIGPGTGIAPFRAFVEERELAGGDSKNWLFFGDQHYRVDFLYQIEWQHFLKQGVLDRLDVAFSRDQDEKVYVQHRMMEQSKDLYAWLQEGAHVYVCGDETHMAKDVHAALIDIVRQEGGMSEDNALEYVRTMQKEKRYQRDVY